MDNQPEEVVEAQEPTQSELLSDFDSSEETVVDRTGDDTTNETAVFDISSFGADYPVDGLVKRIREKHITIPGFQRGYVWQLTRASRFIESLLLGLPVPGIFLAKKPDGTLEVIDGQQRLHTLSQYYDGIWLNTNKGFNLVGVGPTFAGKSYKELDPADKRRLDDAIIHATIVKQESPKGDTGIYHVFERLNTGGMTLQAQEIRACVFPGTLIDSLREVNKSCKPWRTIFGKISPRKRDEELILRFVALFCTPLDKYDAPMKEFMNSFAKDNQDGNATVTDALDLFEQSCDLIAASLGVAAFRLDRALNAAVMDAVLYAVATRLKAKRVLTAPEIRTAHASLLSADGFKELVSSSTADKSKVQARISMALAAFPE